jgi:hypothetical protein
LAKAGQMTTPVFSGVGSIIKLLTKKLQGEAEIILNRIIIDHIKHLIK